MCSLEAGRSQQAGWALVCWVDHADWAGGGARAFCSRLGSRASACGPGRRGAALGRTSCLELTGKGSHDVISRLTRKHRFPSLRLAWEPGKRLLRGGWGEQ